MSHEHGQTPATRPHQDQGRQEFKIGNCRESTILKFPAGIAVNFEYFPKLSSFSGLRASALLKSHLFRTCFWIISVKSRALNTTVGLCSLLQLPVTIQQTTALQSERNLLSPRHTDRHTGQYCRPTLSTFLTSDIDDWQCWPVHVSRDPADIVGRQC